jgi:hypothetical protein
MSNKNSKMKKSNRICLGEGEGINALGEIKKHVLECSKEIEYDNTDDRIKFLLKDTGVLTHDEHDRMVFTKGTFYSYNQVEFNPMDKTISRVFD